MSYLSVYSDDVESPINIMQAFFSKLRSKSDSGTLDLTKIDIHKIFFESQNDEEHPFKDFYFNGNPKFPFSQQIEDVLYEMTVCGMLTRPNPTMVKYNFVSINENIFDELPEKLQSAIDRLIQNAKKQLETTE